MLRGISPLISPDLLATLARMGHGDELVLADAHFPGHALGPPVLRADGLPVADLLHGLLPLITLDRYADAPLLMMAPVAGDPLDPGVEADYRAAVAAHCPGPVRIARLDRAEFYARARHAFAVVMTGEPRAYGNIIVKKGVIEPTPHRA